MRERLGWKFDTLTGYLLESVMNRANMCCLRVVETQNPPPPPPLSRSEGGKSRRVAKLLLNSLPRAVCGAQPPLLTSAAELSKQVHRERGIL